MNITENNIILKYHSRVSPGRHRKIHNDKRVNGRRKAFKQFNSKRESRQALARLNAAGISGWKLWSGRHFYGGTMPTMQYGLVKHTAEPGTMPR